MTDHATAERRARARHPVDWVTCVVLGALLVALGVALAAGRDGPADTRRAAPVVNIGTLPASHPRPAPRTNTRHRATTSHHAVRHRIAAGVTLRLPRLGVSAPIRHVAVVDGVMQVPLDPRQVGWWTGGAAPGDSRGTTVIVGHINYAGVSGALSALPSLRPGDPVTVGPARFRVVAVRTYPKTTGIPQDVFTAQGAPRLALITCGGPFDSATGNYEDNIVAYAVPA